MTLTQLQYFCALAQYEQYTRAAEALHISQPSLSYAITGLEKELGVALTERQSRKIGLTPYGTFFLTYAKRVLDTLDEGVRLTRQMVDPRAGTVSLGYFYSISANFIPHLVEAFHAASPDDAITFRFAQYLNRDILRELREGRIDLAFCATEEPALPCVRIAEQRLFAVVPKGHPLAKEPSIPLSALAGENMVVLEPGSGLRRTVEALFSNHNVPLHIAFEAPECNSALQFVALSQAVSVMPEIPAMRLQPVVVLPLTGAVDSRPVYLAWRGGEPPMPPVRRVRDFILQYVLESGEMRA